MLVNISVNSLTSGRVQICVARPQSAPRPVQTYSFAEEARQVVLAFGIEEKVVDETVKLLPEGAPNQPLFFTPKDVPQRVLWDNGFKP